MTAHHDAHAVRGFSSRRYRIGIDREADDWFIAVMATVMALGFVGEEQMMDEIDARVARAGGSLEMAAAAAEFEFEEKH